MAISALNYGYDIVTFVKKYDIPTRLIQSVIRYQELLIIEIPTTAQLEELNLLAVELEPYNITANDYNNLFTAMQNVQTFITTDLQTYLDALFADYNARMTTMENSYTTRVTDIDAWYTVVKTGLYDGQYFEFDNPIYRKNMTYSAVKTTVNNLPVWTEKYTNNANGSIYAQRVSTKNVSGGWTIVTTCSELSVNTTEVLTNTSGNWSGVIS